jgi:hypothetical protein
LTQVRSKTETLLFFAGLVLVVIGLAKIYSPLAYVGAGLALTVLSMLSRRGE